MSNHTEDMPTTHDRFLGTLLGLAVGDAMGMPVEYRRRGTFEPVTDFRGGGRFKLPAGAWTDDTAMALCLAESLLEKGFDPRNQMERYWKWYSEGYCTSTGIAVGIGNTVQHALLLFAGDPSRSPFVGLSGFRAQGNGSLMRLAPVPLYHFPDVEGATYFSGESSRTTHGSRECIDACRYVGGLIHEILQGKSKTDLERFVIMDLHPDIEEVVHHPFKELTIDNIQNTGYICHSLQAALWAFWTTETFEDGLLRVVNLGDDADTSGAIYGQIAGAYYGMNGIPQKWLDGLVKREYIESVANRLFERARVI